MLMLRLLESIRCHLHFNFILPYLLDGDNTSLLY